jgi:hypothetical protein
LIDIFVSGQLRIYNIVKKNLLIPMSVSSITARKLGYASNITPLTKIERSTINQKTIHTASKTIT